MGPSPLRPSPLPALFPASLVCLAPAHPRRPLSTTAPAQSLARLDRCPGLRTPLSALQHRSAVDTELPRPDVCGHPLRRGGTALCSGTRWATGRGLSPVRKPRHSTNTTRAGRPTPKQARMMCHPRENPICKCAATGSARCERRRGSFAPLVSLVSRWPSRSQLRGAGGRPRRPVVASHGWLVPGLSDARRGVPCAYSLVRSR